MPSLLDIDKFCEELKEVTTTKIVQKRFYHQNGLFSEQIFGPLKNYTCQCGTYYGSFNGGICKTCQVDIVNSEERRRRFAKIVLPVPVVNPIFYNIIESASMSLKKQVDLLMYNRKSVLCYDNDDNSYFICDDTEIPSNIREKWERTDAIVELVTKFSEQFLSDDSNKKLQEKTKFMFDNIENLLIHNIIVLPPDLRPATRNGKVPSVDQINRNYQNILMKKEIMSSTSIELSNKEIFYNYYIQIQKDVFELYEYILEKLAKKEGIIRGNILGKRVDFSARSIISPDPTLDIEYCKLPYLVVLELFKLKIAKKLVETDKFKMLNEAVDFVDDCILYKKTNLFKICQEVTHNQVCLLNRQPSLHRLSMLGFKILVTLDNVIKIHPLICPPYNADFDGDQMAIYIPISEETTKEIYDKLLITNNFASPADGSLTTTPSQDIILGIYSLTSDLLPNLHEKVECKGKMVSKSIKIFNDCLPEDFELIDYSLKKKELIYILDRINRKYDKDIVKVVLDNVKRVGFKYSTLFGSTMSLDKCYIPDAWKTRDFIYEGGNILEQLSRVSSAQVENEISEKFKYSYLVKSGARGTWDQARQIVLTRGFISNSEGQILPIPIKNSLIDGLTEEEFFYSTYGCRKGLLDVANNTASSGYLSRKLIFTCANVEIQKEDSDCGAGPDETLEVFVNSENKAKMMIGKYYYVNNELKLITRENYKDVVNKTLNVKSPLFCKSTKICTRCYGEFHKYLNSNFAGVVSAQTLGEVSTQLVLRSFHTSGVAVIKEDTEDMKQQDVVSDLSVVSGLLHHFKDSDYTKIIHDLFDIYNSSKNINHVHFEILVSQLMWTGDLKWRLQKDRKNLKIEYRSVNQVPSDESWLMGLGFVNPRKHIIKGLINVGNYSGVIDKLLCGENVSLDNK